MWLFFDAVIYLFLISVGAFLIEVGVQWKQIRNRRLTGAIAGFLAFCWLVIFYGSFVEPRMLTVKEYDVTIGESRQTLRAAVVADAHLGPYKGEEWVSRVVETVNAEKPDIVFLVGDFVFTDAKYAEELTPFSDLDAPYGVYAVTGNHEFQSEREDFIVEFLEGRRVTVLRNEHETIDVNGSPLVLAGVDDIWFSGDVYQTLGDTTEEQTVVLLSHNPDAILNPLRGRADLVVSGHVHGGQIRLPFWGPVPDLPTVLGKAFDRGLLDFEGTPVFITPGVGEMGARARLWNPPEVSMLTIHF